MSRNIEQRILELEFRNKQFEEAARETMATLQRLEQSLQFKDSSKGVSALQRIINSINFHPLKSGIAEIQKGFTWAYDEIKRGFFLKMGADVEGLASKMLDLFGWSHVSAGFDKYESEIGSIQTIINTTGKSTEEVMKYTEKLRWFTDETSYYYDDMINAIGRFTSAGVTLDDAVTSMIGIADAAGYFGVNARDASHAMSGFAKALGIGHMDSQSWQWIETAKMATEGFKIELMDAAVAQGKLKKASDGSYKTLKGTEVTAANLKNTLHEAWLDNEVLVKTFHKFGDATEEIYKVFQEHEGEMMTSEIIDEIGDSLDAVGKKAFEASQQTKTWTDAMEYVKTAVQSQWSKTWQLIIGDYDEAVKLWSNVAQDLYEVFVVTGEQRNALLEEWKEANGRTELMASIRDMYEGIKNMIRPIREAWERLFPPMTIDRLMKLTEAFRNFSKKFREVFEGIVQVTKPVQDAVKDVADTVENVINPVERTAEVLDTLARAVIRGDYGNGQARREALQGLAFSYEEIQNKVNELLGCSFRYIIAEQDIADAANEVKDATEGAAGAMDDETRALEEGDGRVFKFRKVFLGLVAGMQMGSEILHTIGESVMAIFGTIKDQIIVPLLDIVLDFAAGIGDALVEMNEKGEFVDGIKDKIYAFTFIATKSIKDFAENCRNKYFPWITKGIEAIGNWWGKHKGELTGGLKGINKFLGSIAKASWTIIQPLLPILGELAGKLIDIIVPAVSKLAEKLEPLGKIVENVVQTIYDKASWLFTYLQTELKNFSLTESYERLKTSVENIKGVLSDLGEIFMNGLFSLFTKDKQETLPSRAMPMALDPGSEGEESKSKLTGFLDTISNKVGDFSDFITRNKQNIHDFFQEFTDNAVKNVKGIATAFTNLIESLGKFGSDTWEGMGTVAGQIHDTMELFTQNSAIPMDKVTENIGKFFERMGNAIEKADLTNLFTIFENILRTGGVVALLKVADGIQHAGEAIANFPLQVNNTLYSFQQTMYAYQRNLNAKNLKTIAEAIGILALAVVGLSFADQDALDHALAVIVVAGVVLSLVLKAYAALQKALNERKRINDNAEALKKAQAEQAANSPNSLLNILITPLNTLANGLSTAAQSWAKKHTFAVLLVAVGATLLMIMNVLKQIQDMQKNLGDFRAAGINLLLIAGGLIAFVTALKFIAGATESLKQEEGKMKYQKSGFTMGFAVSIIAAVVALMLVVKTLKGLADMYQTYDFDTMQNSIGALLIIMGGLAGVMWACSKIGNGWSAAVMLSLATTLNLLMIPVLVLGSYKGSLKRGLGGLFALEALLGIFLLVIIGLNKITKEWGVGDSIGGVMGNFALGLTALAGAMMILGVACGILAFIGWDTIAAGMVKIGTAMLLLAGIGWLLSMVPGMTESMSTLAKNMLMLSAAALLLGVALPFITTGLIALGQGVKNHGEELAIGFGIILGAILSAVVASKAGLIDAFQTFLSGGLEGIFKFLKDPNNRVMIIVGIMILVNIILAAIEALIPGTVDKIIYLLVLLLDSIAKVILQRGGQVFRALAHIVEAVYLLILQLIDDTFGPLGDLVYEVLGINDNKFRRNLTNDTKALENAIDSNIQEAKNTTTASITGAIDEVTHSANDGFSNASGKFGDNAAKEIEDVTQKVDESSQGIVDPLNENTQTGLMDVYNTANGGLSNLSGLFGGFNIGNLDQASLSNYFSSLDMTSLMDQQGNLNVQALSDSMITYLQQNAPVIADAGEEVGKDVGEATENAAVGTTKDTARNYLLGIKNWVGDYSYLADEAGRQVGNTLSRATRSQLRIYSPSREAGEIGMYWDMGLAEGINKFAGSVTKAGENVGYATIDASRSTLYGISSAVNDELSEPVISPVMDLTNVRSGMGVVGGLLDNARLRLSGASMEVSDNIRVRDEMSKRQLLGRNKDVVSEINALRTDVGSLNESMTHMQIVMDSGTLVGEIASPMDSELGIRTQRRIRGV